jgi:hypothetical protein
VWKTTNGAQLDAHQPRSHAPKLGRARERRQVCEHRDATPAGFAITALSPIAALTQHALGRHGRRHHSDHGDGGATWSNVTPPQIKPWTRIFNIEAGHFDRTAYAAANTLRLDDMNPHFWRTHDGGKTWTEINNGIAPGAVANSIREDPRKKGLLYAATDTQVWVSFDDGDHWQSLQARTCRRSPCATCS